MDLIENKTEDKTPAKVPRILSSVKKQYITARKQYSDKKKTSDKKKFKKQISNALSIARDLSTSTSRIHGLSTSDYLTSVNDLKMKNLRDKHSLRESF